MITGQSDIFDLIQMEKPTVIAFDELSSVGDAGTFTNPGDLEAMFQKREAHFQEFNVMRGNWKPYRGWAVHTSSGAESTHNASCYDAELRCRHTQVECYCVGTIVYRVYCHTCETWTSIYSSENEAWEAHLDTCWPGWRELPVLEGKQVGYGYQYTYPDDYPKDFKQSGAPIRECRGLTKYARRHVPGHSPFGGVTVGVIQDCKQHNQKGEK